MWISSYPGSNESVGPSEKQFTSEFLVNRENSLKDSAARKLSQSGKRPPTSFIDPTDWGLYLRISSHLYHIKSTYECGDNEAEQILYGGRSAGRCRTVRLVCAFNRLYAEYSRLSGCFPHDRCEKCGSVYSTPGSNPIRNTSIKNTKTNSSGYHVSSSTAPHTSKDTHHATVSAAYGDTTILDTDIILEPTSTDSTHSMDGPQTSKSIKLPVCDFTQTSTTCSSPHTALVQVDQSESATSARTLLNSTSTTLHITSKEASVSSCNPSHFSPPSHQLLSCRPSNHMCFRLCGRSMRRPENRAQWNRRREALRLCKRLQQFDQKKLADNYLDLRSRTDSRQSLNPPDRCIYYDRVRRAADLANVLVYQRGSHRFRSERVVHWVPANKLSTAEQKTDRSDTHSNTDVRFSTIRLPIALELILPRMQREIEKVMNRCENICDPLEAAAELRESNYDTEACIAYFQQVQHLRDVIHEFLPQKSKLPTSGQTNQDRSSKVNGTLCQTYESLVPTSKRACESSSPTNPTWILTYLQDQLITLRQSYVDVRRRLVRIRNDVIAMTAKLRKDLEEKLVTELCAIISADNSAIVDGRLPTKSLIFPVCSTASSVLETGTEDISLGQMAKLMQENRALKMTLRTEENRRKAVFNMMQEYLGNIRIYCRCRAIAAVNSCIEARPLLDTILLHLNPEGTNTETYKFDRVFDAQASQAEVYTELAPTVCSFLDGYNVCFLTYGGEASGKTYTLLGAESTLTDKQGIAERALRTALAEREARRHEWDYRFVSALVEIYNDTLIDMLSSEKRISIRVDCGPDHMLENLQTMEVETDSDIEQLLSVCRERRHTGRTALNDKSSRSHLIIFVRLSTRSRIHDTHVGSLLALCDLAGFEDIIKAETLGDPVLTKEAGYINRSLTALNRVFMNLRTQDPMNISYRDSKLTFLLKPFLTHSGKCILIVTVRTDRNNIGSTQSTLRFARDSRGVTLGRPRRQFNLEKLLMDEVKCT